MTRLPIVAWVDGDGRWCMTTWMGQSREVRVRNFDPRKGIMQDLTEADIVEEGGTLVRILTGGPRKEGT